MNTATVYKVKVTARNGEARHVFVCPESYGLESPDVCDVLTLAEKESGFVPSLITGSSIVGEG